MHKYTHHIGDYAQATSHLTFIEDAAYSRLIRKYYADEKPLPCDIQKLQRIIGARTKEEKKAVVDVLSEFFYEKNNFYHHKRCDAEIEIFLEFSEEAKNKRANMKERQTRCRDDKKRLFNQLKSIDIVPPYDTKIEVLRALVIANQSRLCHEPVTRDSTVTNTAVTVDATGNHSPLPTLHSPLSTLSNSQYENGQRAGWICARFMEVGITANPSNQELLTLLETKLTDADFIFAAKEAAARQKGFVYGLKIAAGRLNEINDPIKSPPAKHNRINQDFSKKQYTGGKIS